MIGLCRACGRNEPGSQYTLGFGFACDLMLGVTTCDDLNIDVVSNGPVIDADHDLVKSLERWVEQGTAPDRIVAIHYLNNVPAQGVQFQRPLCAYPR